MIAYTYEVKGIEGYQRALELVPAAMQREILKTLLRAGNEVMKAARELAPRGVTANLLGSILPEVVAEELACYVGPARNTAPYGRIIEEGRKPGEIFPPWEMGGGINRILARWAIQKAGMDVDMAKPSTLFPLARAIHQKASKPQPYMVPALKKMEPVILKLFNAAAARALESANGTGGTS